MTVPFQPSGVWTALVTPFDDAGQIDVGRFRRLVEFQVAQGVTGVLPCGTTGESPTLTWKEHDDIVHAVEAHHNEVEPRTVEAILTQAADAISGSRPGARR